MAVSRTHLEKITLTSPCRCPKCASEDAQLVGTIRVRSVHGEEDARHMKCKCGNEYFCHSEENEEDRQQDCVCDKCATRPGSGLTEVDRKEMPGGVLVRYKCDKCGREVECLEPPEPEACKCPGCGNADEFEEIDRQPLADGKSFAVKYRCKKCKKVFECVLQDGGGECVCPKCNDFDAEEVSRQKIADGPEGEVWKVRFKCRKDGEEFECQQQEGKECKCPACGSKNRSEISRNEMTDGSSTVRFKCDDCGKEFECHEGEGDEGECKCPKCGTSPAEKPDEFDEVERKELADGKVKTTYKHKKDDGTFECTSGPGEGDVCKCPKCGKTSGFEEVGRRKAANGKDIVKLKCKDDGAVFECLETEGDPCKCPVCDSPEHLEQIKSSKKRGGSLNHHRCKKGHKRPKGTPPCEAGIPDCVVCCIETDDGDGEPGCVCPNCGASVGKGLVELGQDVVDLDGKKAVVRHMKCTACGYVRGKCSTGKYDTEEATECVTVVPDAPKCPKCGSSNLKEIGRETKEDGTVVLKLKCEDCGEEFDIEIPPGEPDDADGEKPRCPDCGEELSVIKTTKLTDSISIAHMRCPKGHAHPDTCSEGIDVCVMDVPSVETPDSDCPCPCTCGACSFIQVGVCKKGGRCLSKVRCKVCGRTYLCPPSGGITCPICCSSDYLGQILKCDAKGEPIMDGGKYVVIVYCRRCKKGQENAPVAEVGDC